MGIHNSVVSGGLGKGDQANILNEKKIFLRLTKISIIEQNTSTFNK